MINKMIKKFLIFNQFLELTQNIFRIKIKIAYNNYNKLNVKFKKKYKNKIKIH